MNVANWLGLIFFTSGAIMCTVIGLDVIRHVWRMLVFKWSRSGHSGPPELALVDPELEALEREHRAELEAFDRALALERQKRVGGPVRKAFAWQCNMCGAFISMDRPVCDCGHVRPKAGRAFALEPKTQHAAPIETGYLRAARRNKARPLADDLRATELMLADAVRDAEELARRVREKIKREGIEGF